MNVIEIPRSTRTEKTATRKPTKLRDVNANSPQARRDADRAATPGGQTTFKRFDAGL